MQALGHTQAQDLKRGYLELFPNRMSRPLRFDLPTLHFTLVLSTLIPAVRVQEEYPKESSMRGWILLDGLIGVGGVSAVASGTSSIGIKGLTAMALFLLFLTLMTRAVRGRA
jgi:hypothetical protein